MIKINKGIEYFEKEFKFLISRDDIDQDSKDIQLSQLMIEMEQEFGIPRYKDLTYQRKNPEVINLYKKITFARSI